jgi:mannose-1-phosphate guanylyltransferase
MNKDLYVVLMAGGAGVRFWPYSRNKKPKQFLDVLGTGKTLLQATYERFLPICLPENIFVVAHEQHTEIVKEQLPQLQEDQLLSEPMRKNTAPCIAYASFKIVSINKNAIIVVSPSDHLILKEDAFLTVISNAVVEAADQKKLITLGITPTRPETGYGYIQFHQENSFIKRVKTFTEKPEFPLAKNFVERGDFVCNA